MTDKPPYTLPPSLQDAMKLIGFDQGREASYSFVSINPGDKVEWLDVPHKQIDFVQFRTELLDVIAKQLGISYEVMARDWREIAARERRLDQVRRLLFKGGKRPIKRAARIYSQGGWSSAGFHALCHEVALEKVRLRAAVTNAILAAYIKDIK